MQVKVTVALQIGDLLCNWMFFFYFKMFQILFNWYQDILELLA